MCALAKLCHFRPILADGRYKLLKYSDTLLLTGNSNVVIRLSMCNDMFPRRFNHLHAFSLIVSSDDPSFGTITWDDNASVICFFEPCGKKPFEVRHIPGHRSIMTRTWKSDGTGSSPIRGNVALQRIPVSLVVASCCFAPAMGGFFFPGYIPVHLNNQKIQCRLNAVHQFLANRCIVMTPFPDTFPSVSVFSCQVVFRLKHDIHVFFPNNTVNNTFQNNIISGTFANDSYVFHIRVGTPPSRPLIQSRDSGWPSLISSWETLTR